jgi:FKBP12-rapamycin complex-associated protein
LREFTGELANDIGIGALDANGALVIPDEKVYGEYTDLLAQCHVELGQWQASLKVPGEPVSILGYILEYIRLTQKWDPTDLIQDYRIATELSPTWYKAWHTWALSNFEVITQLETSHDGLSTHHFNTYIIPAVEGFLRSISLSPGNALQDTLRLLTLWFDYGYQVGVNQAISDGLHTVSIDVWLEVIPQIIARVQTPRATIQALIIRLLHDVGKAHPQALIYPLTVAAKSNVNARKSVALNVMAKMREHSNTIVDQAEMISTELIRAAILWHEMWYDGLEEASKYYFADQNIPGMYQVLEPLHEMVERVRRCTNTLRSR